MRTTAILFRTLILAGWLSCLMAHGATTHEPVKPGSYSAVPLVTRVMPPAEADGWSTATVHGLSSALLEVITHTKLQRAALTRYLAAEGLSYGAVVSEAAQADRDTAAGLFAYLDSRQHYVDQLSLQDLAVLPVGLKLGSDDANTKIQLGILKATFLPDRALLSVFVRIELPAPDPNSTIKVRELFFGADNIVFSRDGGIQGDFNLVLLGDFVQPLGNMTLRIKGGLNRFQSPDVNAMTYAKVNCEKLVGLGIAAEVLFPRSMLVPINPQTGEVQTTGQVQGSFHIDAPTFSDIVAGVTLQPFAVTGYEKFGFILTNVMLDLSTVRNAPGVVFPADYFARSGNETPDGNTNTWKGVYISQFSILLPPEFKAKATTTRLAINASHMLFDRNGVTGRVGMSGGLYTLTASGWKMTLNAFELAFEKNKLVGGRFGGGLALPIANETLLAYTGLIDDRANYTLSLSNVTALTMPCWRATAQLAPASRVELAVINGAFKPKATLHGRLGIFCSVKGEASDSVNARVKFKGIVFENLRLQTEAPYLSASYFGYESETKLAGFPVTVNRIGVVFPSPTQAGLRFDLGINLMENKFSGSADFTVLGEINTSGEEHQWTFKEVKFSQLCVKGTASNFTLDGCIAVFDEDPTYGDGFGGRVSFTIKSLASREVKGDVAALFGVKDFRYWFVSGGAAFSRGIPIAGPLELTGMYLGAYHNMAPSAGGTNPIFLTTSSSSPMANVTYVPNNKIHLGFKAVAGLRAIEDNVFKGTAGLEMTFSRSEGLNTIAFYGEGQLIGFTNNSNSLTNLTSHYQGVVAADGNPYSQLASEYLEKAEVDEKAKKAYTILKDAQGNIRATLSLLYDHPNRTFHGDATVNIAISRFMTGSGWMQLHFDPNEWYVHVNNPGDRARALIDFGVKAKVMAYFMAGHRIPDIPAPPAHITSHLRNWHPTTGRSDTASDSLKTGKGVVFGASADLRYELDLWLPYLRLDASAGFDMMMRTNTPCKPDAMYARGQVYAWLQGEAGVRFFGRRPILTVGAATLFDGGLADPSWMSGAIALYLKLGKVINTTVNFDLSLGPVCR